MTMKAYCIIPIKRAEKSKPSRHLSEYTQAKAEIVDFSGLLSSIEDLVIHTMRHFYGARKAELWLYPDFEFICVPSKPFLKIKYSDAIVILRRYAL